VRLVDSWKEEQLPARQRVLADAQLQNYRNGKSVEVFDVFIASLDAARGVPTEGTLLEIGCSSGYYSEVLKISGRNLHYTGCDYSDGFISLARSIYPDGTFDVEDATKLSYADDRFDVVVSGCCLLHIPDYKTAIAETARVAKDYVIFHRTPVVYGQETKYFRKQAYGLETIEIHLSEEEFFSLTAQNGLELVTTITLHETRDPHNASVGSANRTYLCRKSI
jgi:SAM-dependent methyltransferase